MFLETKDYLHFHILDDEGNLIKEVVGVDAIKPALPGDTVDESGKLLERAAHPPLVGILHVTSKVKYGLTGRGFPIYLFEPMNRAYPPMIVGCSQKNPVKDLLAVVTFDTWEASAKFPRGNLLKVIGNCGDPLAESQSILQNYSPWSYPKGVDINPDYANELRKRHLLKGLTFNIDPPGCEDVDDIFTLEGSANSWKLTISITDIAAAIQEGSPLDVHALRTGQTLYPENAPPKHMFPHAIGIEKLSLLPKKERNVIALSINYNGTGLQVPTWHLAKASVDKAYTYMEADEDKGKEMAALKAIAEAIAGKPLEKATEWVEALMIFYNKEAGKLLQGRGVGILRAHDAPDFTRLESLKAVHKDLEMFAYSSATYVSGAVPAQHWGLGTDGYAHASSPLRRYADLYNQRCIHAILKNQPVDPVKPAALRTLNRLQKNAKAFDRDSFFLTALYENRWRPVHATIVELQQEKQCVVLYVPTWNRLIRVKATLTLDGDRVILESKDATKKFGVHIGKEVLLAYHIQFEQARWKDKILFSISPTDEGTGCPE
jgi:exoribonuclease R